MELYKQQYSEAFKSGTNQKVMRLLGSVLRKRTGYKLDSDIPDGYENSLGKFRAFTCYHSDESELRINFQLSDSDYVYSVDYFKKNAEKPTETLVFDKQTNIVQVINTITDLVSGSLKEEDYTPKYSMTEKRRKTATGGVVKNWITNPEFKDEREKMIQSMKFSKLYALFVRSDETADIKKVPSQSSFAKFVKEYLKDQGMTNPNIRASFKKKSPSVEIPVILPEEKPKVTAFKEPTKMMFSWQDAFEDMEDDFGELMADKHSMPFGQLVYGNGGTGKSYFFVQEKPKHSMEIVKGAPNLARLIRILYDYRNIDVIVFDDADSVVTSANSANILKMATDDTAKERVVYLPKGSGKDMAGIEPDVYDDDGNLIQAFKFSASIVVITNLKDIKDKALKTRLYLNPIFMTKEDIIEKIKITSKPEDFGCSNQQAEEVAELMTGLIESGEFSISNAQLSYRFFKIGLKMIKNYPNRWKGKVMRKLHIGVRTSI